MAAGPMDYTPGAMTNVHAENFSIRYNRPMSMGTRCHQIALYIIYESPLQMLCDNPTAYYKEDECTRYISRIPVTWDETVVLDAEIENLLVIARRKGQNWYVGALNNSEEKQIEIEFSFLKEGSYTAEILKDGINAEKHAEDYKSERQKISRKDKLNIKLAKGGGWCAIIKKDQ
jgi:alpha-glucosidase